MTQLRSNLNAADQATFVAALGDIFEHAPWVARSRACGSGRSRRWLRFTTAMCAAVRARRRGSAARADQRASRSRRQGGARWHDDPDSAGEQASAGLDRLSEEEFARFHRLNDRLPRRNSAFPSSSACAGTPGIRSCGSSSAGCRTIRQPSARPRWRRFSASRRCASISASPPPDRLKVHGRLSTHVLDTRADVRPPASRSSSSSCPTAASAGWSNATSPTRMAAPTGR